MTHRKAFEYLWKWI